MNRKSVMAAAFLLFLGQHCGTSLKLPPSEDLRVRLTDQYIELLGEDTMATFHLTDTTVLNSPAIPIYRVAVTPPAGRKAGPVDSARVSALVTKRGNVKRAWVEYCRSPYFRNNVLRAVVQWKFQPNMRNGVFTDTVVVLSVPLRY